MYMPSSYQSDNQTREQIIKDIYEDGRLDTDKAIQTVQDIPNDESLQGLFEAIESMDGLFPQLPYTSYDDEVEYLSETEYDLFNMVQAFAKISKKRTNGIGYYRLVPYQVNDEALAAIVPVSKDGTIHDLKAYEQDPDSTSTEAEHTSRGTADYLNDYAPRTIQHAQTYIDDKTEETGLNLHDLYRITLTTAKRYFPKVYERMV